MTRRPSAGPDPLTEGDRPPIVNQMVDCSGPVEVYAALGDPTRQRIVELLSHGERSVSSVADTLPISLQGTMKHLRLLVDAGLVTQTKTGRTVTCHLRPEGLLRGEVWLHHTRMFWAGQLNALADSFKEKP